MTDAAIVIDQVRKRFRVGRGWLTALDGLVAQVPRGRITGLVGPDGAGKTTLFRLICGLLLPDSGRIEVLGLDSVQATAALRQRVGYMPQGSGMYGDLSVLENLDLYANLRGLRGARRDERVRHLLDVMDLAHARHRPAAKLSGGMAQKLGLACLLLEPPDVLLLDEPSAGVDPLSRQELWRIVRGLADDGMTVLWSTAYLDEAERCDAILLLLAGRLVFDGRADDFTARATGRILVVEGADLNLRRLQRRAVGDESVVDAIVRRGGLRVVLAADAEPEAARERLAAGLGAGARIERTSPRFEDAFVAELASASTSKRLGSAAAVADEAGWQQRTQTPDPAIRATGLTRRFGSFTAVDAVDFEVARGEIFGLLGPNGAGKSTIFKMLAGLLPPSAGAAEVAGTDVRRAASARQRIGYVAQHFSLYGDLSVRQNLAFFAGVYALGGARARERIGTVSAQIGLDELADRPSRALTIGHQRRLSLACAVLHQPAILFLDEPTSGVDPLTRREFWLRINAMADQGVTVLVTTHFMEEAEYCDRVAIVLGGRIIAHGAPADIIAEHAPDEGGIEAAFVSLVREHRGGA